MKYIKMHDQKYYCRKLDNNKLKYDNRLCYNQILNFKPNKKRNFISLNIHVMIDSHI